MRVGMVDIWRGLLVAAVICYLVFFVGYCAHLYATCEGHVLKNSLDWPVCVK